MTPYPALSELGKAVRRRTVEGLLRLRHAFGDPQRDWINPIPQRTSTATLLLGTWNIRELGGAKAGPRSIEALLYIAEILRRFDIVAVQEVRDNLDELNALLRMLGPGWDRIYTDVTLGPQGNGERMAFVFDSKKIRFTGLAGELVLDQRNLLDTRQFARTPYVCSFRAGSASFTLCTVHAYYGPGGANDPQRVAEIAKLSKVLGKQTRPRTRKRWGTKVEVPPSNLILLGDFNIFKQSDETMRALLSGGFRIPDALQNVPGSNVDKKKKYDQIAIGEYPGRLEATGNAGVFDYYEYVFRDLDEAAFRREMKSGFGGGQKGWAFKTWRTFKLSDHLPMWQEFRVDFSDEHLQGLLG